MTTGDWNPYDPGCPSRRLLDRIGDRWTVLVVGTLDAGPQRFSAIAARIQGISQKMLTQTLRALERDGFVQRTVYAEVPPRVEYELTAFGRSLQRPLHALEEWAVANMTEVERHNESYAVRTRVTQNAG